MPNLLENRLLMQYLSAAGQDIGAGKPIGTNVDVVTQQNIRAQSYVELLSKMLSGGAKMTLDKENISIKGPMAMLQGDESVAGNIPQAPGYAVKRWVIQHQQR